MHAAPRRWLLGGLALAVVLVLGVLLLTGGSSDEPKLTVAYGARAAGFPLRGKLAHDTKAIRAAAKAWLADDARRDSGRVLDHEEDVEMRALWAGRVRGTKVVILAQRNHAALVELGSDKHFHVQDVEPIRDDDDPCVVEFGQAVLVDTQADAAFLPAIVRADEVAPLDGLWVTAAPGVLVLRAGLRRLQQQDRTAPAAVVVSNRPSTWLIDRALQARLVPWSARGGFAPPASQRLVAAATVDSEREQAQWDHTTDPPKLRLVQDRSLPVVGPTMILTAGPPSFDGRDRVLAAHGGSLVRGRDKAERMLLGDGSRDDSNLAYAEHGQALAAAIVDGGTRGLSVLVAGGPEIETIEVLTGRRRVTRPGPVAVVPVPEATDLRAGEPPRPRGDLAVLGRTRAGTVVVPRTIRAAG